MSRMLQSGMIVAWFFGTGDLAAMKGVGSGGLFVSSKGSVAVMPHDVVEEFPAV